MNIARCVVQVVSLGLAMSLALGACNRTEPAPTVADGAPAPNQSSPSSTQSVPSAPVVRTDAGDVRGTTSDGVTSFKGIPYAAPPVGKLRWRAPQPVQPWQGVRDATAFADSCMQVDDVPKSEDCLKLNVWRPASATADKPLPVMVWMPTPKSRASNMPACKGSPEPGPTRSPSCARSPPKLWPKGRGWEA